MRSLANPMFDIGYVPYDFDDLASPTLESLSSTVLNNPLTSDLGTLLRNANVQSFTQQT